jgi:hypothetical protein
MVRSVRDAHGRTSTRPSSCGDPPILPLEKSLDHCALVRDGLNDTIRPLGLANKVSIVSSPGDCLKDFPEDALFGAPCNLVGRVKERLTLEGRLKVVAAIVKVASHSTMTVSISLATAPVTSAASRSAKCGSCVYLYQNRSKKSVRYVSIVPCSPVRNRGVLHHMHRQNVL